MVRPNLTEAKKIVPKVHALAHGELMRIYGETSPKPAEGINLINLAETILRTVIREDSELLRFCSDCHIVYIKQDDEESRSRFNSLDPVKRKTLLAFAHCLNDIFNRPIRLPMLTAGGVDLGGGLCQFCGRINGSGNLIRKIQKKESHWDCFGTSFDFCSEMEHCDYQLWDKDRWKDSMKLGLPRVECVIRQEYLSIDKEGIFNSPINWWVWALRVSSLKKRRRYQFNIRRSQIDS